MSEEYKDLIDARRIAGRLADHIQIQMQLAASRRGLAFLAGERSKDEEFEENYRAFVITNFECSLGDLRAGIYSQVIVGHNRDSCAANIKISKPGSKGLEIIALDQSTLNFKIDTFIEQLERAIDALEAIEEAPAQQLPAAELRNRTVMDFSLEPPDEPIVLRARTVTAVFTRHETLVLELYRRARGLTSHEEALRIVLAENTAETPSEMHVKARQKVLEKLKKRDGHQP
jgi:hypothetical protein